MFNMATNPQTGPGQQWSQLITLFSETKKVYASHDPFLSPQKLGFVDKAHVDTINKANMATFVCGLFGGREDVGFSHLNEFFLDTFIGEGAQMDKSHIQLFIELKTQAYISAVVSNKAATMNGSGNRKEILDALFPSQLGEQLLQRRPGAMELSPTEYGLVDQVQNRRTALSVESNSETAILALPLKYPWEGFLKVMHDYVASNSARSGKETQVQTAVATGQDSHGRQFKEFISSEATHPQTNSNAPDNVAEKAARAAHFAMENYGSLVATTSSSPVTSPTPMGQPGPAAAQQPSTPSSRPSHPVSF